MPNFFRAATNTIIAPWWTVWLARIFGKKLIGYDSGMKVTCHSWRGKIYVTGCKLDMGGVK